MIKISCYKTTNDSLTKTFCQLAQKCYNSSLNTCVITDNEQLTEELDRTLWTFSKKFFIPHATDKDPIPEKQPIFITNSIINPNCSSLLIVVNPSTESLLKIISEPEFLIKINKVLIIFDNDDIINFHHIKNIFIKSHLQITSIDFFQRNINGSWQEINNLTDNDQ